MPGRKAGHRRVYYNRKGQPSGEEKSACNRAEIIFGAVHKNIEKFSPEITKFFLT
jgi:hypothetical protein